MVTATETVTPSRNTATTSSSKHQHGGTELTEQFFGTLSAALATAADVQEVVMATRPVVKDSTVC